MMKVVLRDDVAGVGKTGDVKQVKDGFARNFLLPRDLAFVATEHTLKQIEMGQKKKEAKIALEKKKAQELAEKFNNLSVTLAVEVNEDGNLYGSLTAQDIERALSAEGVEIDKKMILLASPIKDVGIYDLDIKLHPEVTVKIKVWVVKK
jgi:large subunit ribosomal protein L9